ncbi:MAG: ribonucleoside-diphosphate reductase subunit alpha [Erysipelotrichaceae bacterium]|nr:ribonucleoside-diphosphate reductase subunit alpha [Erysipelotrichaceae bacterium]
MQITKRNQKIETYDVNKIKNAICASFASVDSYIEKEMLEKVILEIETQIMDLYEKDYHVDFDQIQDLVENTLMKNGFYKEAKSYVLYRDEHSRQREARHKIEACFQKMEVKALLKRIQKKYKQSEYSFQFLHKKMFSFQKGQMTDEEQLQALVKAAVELTTQEAPKWEYIAAMIHMQRFLWDLKKEEEARGIHSFYDKLMYLTQQGLYGSYILESYTKQEIMEFAEMIDNTRNDLLTYSSLDLLLKRYVIHTGDLVPLETPQEMFMGIAMHLAMKEKDRKEWVKRFYDMLSTWKVTMATPTMSNARKPYHQLSSCFIDTVADNLDGIYRSIDNFAKVSKFGGGMGLYFGKVRAQGSTIRGFKGAAGGIIRWIKLVNDTAVAVDQLGVRQGAVAVYLDAWHKDLPEFLQLRTNNGDDRMKAHDVFPAVCYPDYFWKMAKENIDGMWYLMCPHEIKTIKGYQLEDCYGEEWEEKYLDCIHDYRIKKREIPMKELIRLILKSAVETGTPFTFNRDIVNRMNPNGHQGMIYCSNLCTEIAQNMREITLEKREIVTEDQDSVVVEITKPGDFVVCNLASLVLGNIDVKHETELKDTVFSVVRALDNVIDLNFYPLEYAKITNQKFRPIGLGVSGYHHLLVQHGIAWESEDHIRFADQVFEDINYYAVSASCGLAKERGSYSHFANSDWDTGAYFTKRDYNSERWTTLAQKVHTDGIRNAYLMAIAPTSSTSILAGTTAGLDPIMKRFFLEEKKGSIMPRVAPDLSMKTFWLYKNAHIIDQSWSVRAAGARQRHIDQAQSMNLYITNEFTMRQVLELFIQAWECGVKTIYYVRSKALEVEECESCSA